MPRQPCTLPDCHDPQEARGYCVSHYNHWRRRGTPYPPPSLTFEERLWAKIDRSSGPDACWPWTGATSLGGYGHIKLPKDHPSGKQYSKAYRATFEIENGPVPKGKELDHTCRNPPCCNPAHIRVIPRKLICKRGHQRKELPTGKWYCPTCNQDYARKA